ncbi:hypothetical protein GpartN1_g3123.t1 [Galdieria partita]|uniref:Uncharacterized protein n=1 Tax=Galdieria partita TaxID=83374 RepID=A0A9C7UQ96_9RHOD|nr:hypothetical protein GpartN1_g3123.t1 [Galdieria partita]
MTESAFQFLCSRMLVSFCWSPSRFSFGSCKRPCRTMRYLPGPSSRLPRHWLPCSATLDRDNNSRERLSIFDLTVEEVAEDYGLPLDYVVDVLVSNGVGEPINPTDILASRVKESKKMDVLEALSFSDAIEIGDLYLQPTVEEMAQANGLAVSQVLDFLCKEGFEAPLGSRTRIPPQYISTVDQYITQFLSRFNSQR